MRAARAHSHFEALDEEALEIGAGIGGVEDLAVEEGLLAARRRRRNIGRRHRELLRGRAPEVLAVDLLDQRLAVERRFELAPANVLGDKPEIVALERIGGVLAPELHVLLGVLLD